jgi:hypothetical protein
MQDVFGETTLTVSDRAFGQRLLLAEGPLELDWQHCSVTSEFLGDLFAMRAARDGLDDNDVRHSIGYLANELLENAVKFRHPGDIAIDARLEGRRFALRVTNLVSPETAIRFKALLAEITSRDPGELLIEKIEANAENPDTSGSGLGLLTLLSDYGARLGWRFETDAPSGAIRLETFAVLDWA